MMNSRTKIIGLVAVLFFIASVLGVFGIVYTINARQQTIEEYKLRIAERQTHEQELKSLERLVEESKFEREKMHALILSDEHVIDFLALLETLGRESGARVEASSLQINPLKEEFEELSLTVSVSGSYDAVVHLLTELESIPYQSVVADASLSREIFEGEAPSWKGQFTLRVTKYKKI